VNQRILMAAALSAGISVVACSRPSSQNDPALGSPESRQIELVGAPGSDAPLASDLETKRSSKARAPSAPRVAAAAAAAGQPDATPTHDHAMSAVAISPRVGTTTSVIADPDRDLARAPVPSAPSILVSTSFGAAAVSGGPSAGTEPDAGPGPIHRGPTILIRGGMGGPHDDCKIHGTSPGLAINRMTPGFGNEVRGNTGGRFPRGGIR
jgi:hypothetical protein